MHNYRQSRHVTINVDGEKSISGVAPGDSRELNVYDALYIGGRRPSYNRIEDLHTRGLHGCIESVTLDGSNVLASLKTPTTAVNIEQCRA